jgi:hypothetical protein
MNNWAGGPRKEKEMAESTNLVKWGTYDTSVAEHEQKEWDRSNSKWMKLAEGSSTVRILPPPPDKKSPFRVVWTHYVEMPGLKDALSIVCPNREARKRCPVCEQADRMKASVSQADQERAKGLFARRRVYANVIDRADMDAGPKILAFGKTIHEALITLRKDPDWGDFCDPIKGYDIGIKRAGTTKNDTEYQVVPKMTSSLHADQAQIMSWIGQQADLEVVALYDDYDTILAKLRGDTLGHGQQGPTPGASQAASSGQHVGADGKARTVVDAASAPHDDDKPF